MGNADLVRCVLGHVLAGIKAYNARELACAALAWTRVSRAHWDACQSANGASGAWLRCTWRHFGAATTTLVSDNTRANFFALCRRAQSDHMGLPFFMRFLVSCNASLAEAILEQQYAGQYTRQMEDADWRVRGWRINMRIAARHALNLLAWHPHGKYAPYDVQGMVTYFLGPRGIGTLFEDCDHKMAAFLYPDLRLTNWDSFKYFHQPKARNARRHLVAVRKLNALWEQHQAECA